MNLKQKKEYEWTDEFFLKCWASRKDRKTPTFSKDHLSKTVLLIAIASLLEISEEYVVILDNITELIGIIYYEKESELELMIGNSLSASSKITFTLKDPSVLKCLKDL